jgi:hypothetical protein
VLELTGKMLQKVYADNNSSIDISRLKSGVYLLNGPKGSYRFVKQP